MPEPVQNIMQLKMTEDINVIQNRWLSPPVLFFIIQNVLLTSPLYIISYTYKFVKRTIIEKGYGNLPQPQLVEKVLFSQSLFF